MNIKKKLLSLVSRYVFIKCAVEFVDNVGGSYVGILNDIKLEDGDILVVTFKWILKIRSTRSEYEAIAYTPVGENLHLYYSIKLENIVVLKKVDGTRIPGKTSEDILIKTAAAESISLIVDEDVVTIIEALQSD